MAHDDRSIRERFITLAEEDNCKVSTARHGYSKPGRMSKLEGAEELGYGACQAPLTMLR